MRVKQSHSHSKQPAFMVGMFLQRHQLSLFPDARRSYSYSHEISGVLHYNLGILSSPPSVPVVKRLEREDNNRVPTFSIHGALHALPYKSS
jgi:hypothetical protein